MERPTGGLGRHLVGTDDTLPSKMMWDRLADSREIVGTCRHPNCGGALVALRTSEHDRSGEAAQVTWYEATCLTCHRDVGAPNGRVFAGSALHSHTPRGWLDKRAERDAEERAARGGQLPDEKPKRRRRDQW